jgi:hypothetical protein
MDVCVCEPAGVVWEEDIAGVDKNGASDFFSPYVGRLKWNIKLEGFHEY